MNKKIWLLPLLVFLFSCSSVPNVSVPVDYSQEDVLLNEISEIKKILEINPIKAIWRTKLIANYDNIAQNLRQNVLDLLNECVQILSVSFNESITEKNYIAAQRVLKTLQAVDCYFPEQLNLSSEELHNLILSSFSVEEKKQDAASPVSSFIEGTITIWVDQGIHVSKGVGYASHVIGSGFFINNDGYAVTNYHVIQSEVDPEYEGYSRLYVKLASDSDTRIPAKVIGWDAALDLALLKVEIDSPFAFSLGESKDLDIGDKIYAIGSPAGLERTLTSGIVSATDRDLFSIGKVMQIDAAINSGNSGGPIIDSEGSVQAIAFAGMLEYEGLNFAIPVEYLKANLPFLFAGGERLHGWIEAFGKEVKANEFTGQPAGLQVQYVIPGGTASRSGIVVNDVILSLDGYAISDLASFHNAMLYVLPETVVSIELWNPDGTTRFVPVYVEQRPENPGYQVYNSDIIAKSFLPIFGMSLESLSSSGKKYRVSSVLKGSTADESGFSEFDPVEIIKIRFSPDNDVIYAQIYTKKRKNGYFEVDIMIATSLDSPYYF
ncbi:MAG: trypsin-like peptidase domain-containing protein [Spirochaetaceae bacterium]|nr:trypsin-like peptidase domain-containing protein [Spirochaetaceae bacterium]